MVSYEHATHGCTVSILRVGFTQLTCAAADQRPGVCVHVINFGSLFQHKRQ